MWCFCAENTVTENMEKRCRNLCLCGQHVDYRMVPWWGHSHRNHCKNMNKKCTFGDRCRLFDVSVVRAQPPKTLQSDTEEVYFCWQVSIVWKTHWSILVLLLACLLLPRGTKHVNPVKNTKKITWPTASAQLCVSWNYRGATPPSGFRLFHEIHRSMDFM